MYDKSAYEVISTSAASNRLSLTEFSFNDQNVTPFFEIEKSLSFWKKSDAYSDFTFDKV